MVDDAWQTRIPQGWIRYPDGTIGPPNQVGSDWNAPYRQAPGVTVPQSPGAPTPGGGVTPTGAGPSGRMLPGSGVLPRSASAGAPTMGYPALGGTSLNTTGPQVFPPNSRPIAPNKQVGRFTGGTSTDNTFEAGKPMGDVAAGGAFPGWLGKGGFYGLGGYLTGKTIEPQPAGGPDAPTNAWFQRPSGVGGMPGPQVTNPTPGPAPPGVGGPYVGGQGASSQMGMPFPQNEQVSPQMGMPWAGNNGGRPYGQPAAAAPPGNPSPAPVAPGVTPGPVNGRINPASVNLGNNPWITFDRPNMSPQNSARNSQGATQMGMLDLSKLFGGGQPAAPAPAAPAAGSAIGSPAPAVPPSRPRGALAPPTQAPGPMDPSIIARQNMGGPGPMDPSILAWQRRLQPGYNGPDALTPIGITQ
jgi:hypothetical protein